MKALAGALLCTALGACATPYQSAEAPGFNSGGYRDRPLEKNRFALSVEGSQMTSFETLEAYFHRRAGELCEGRPHTDTMDRTRIRRPGPTLMIGSNPQVLAVVGETLCRD